MTAIKIMFMKVIIEYEDNIYRSVSLVKHFLLVMKYRIHTYDNNTEYETEYGL